MKKFVFLLLSIALTPVLFAQCEKTVILTSSKTQFLDEKGNARDTKEMPTKVKISKSHVTVYYGAKEDDIIEGDIRDLKCNWQHLYQSGNATFASLLAKPNGETKDASFVFEAIEGKLYLTVVLNGMPGKMRLLIDDYKEAA